MIIAGFFTFGRFSEEPVRKTFQCLLLNFKNSNIDFILTIKIFFYYKVNKFRYIASC